MYCDVTLTVYIFLSGLPCGIGSPLFEIRISGRVRGRGILERSCVMENKLFHVEVREGIFLISSEERNGRSMALGEATENAYLVIGQQQALLFDLAVKDPELYHYACSLTDKPVMVVLSHGHFDHVYFADLVPEVWIHPADEVLLRDGMLGLPPVSPCPAFHPLYEGDVIDLGDRQLRVYQAPGHTMGSILLLDEKTKTMLAGDTGGRRLVYGISGDVPLTQYCQTLRRLQKLDFEVICTAHDRMPLPKAHLEHMLRMLYEKLPLCTESWTHPRLPGMEMVTLVHGDEKSLDYFYAVAPKKYAVKGLGG